MTKKFLHAMLIFTCAALVSTPRAGAQFTPNYDETKVPDYTLPDPLVLSRGGKVSNARTWTRQRRPEVLRLFETHVYGRSPDRPAGMTFDVTTDRNALGGLATRKQVWVYLNGDPNGPKMDILIYLPNQVRGPAPVFLGLNFFGNHTIHADPDIRIPETWMRANKDMGVIDHRATEAGRGKRANRWPVETLLERGYGLATIYCGDLEPDSPEGWKDGVRSVFGNPPGDLGEFAPDDWGAIGAWAWGLSRAMDYFETDRDIDHKRVAVMGHSRLGKTALWAGARDERFAITISNNSGCGGAALSRRRYGETVARINDRFPHWFCGNFDKYNNNEDALPVDQHMLVALIAPRPVYVASAEEDRWADPKGEFLAAKHAEPVYALFRKKGLGADEMPALNQAAGETIGYHIRTGRHDVTDYDWGQYLNFADRHLRIGQQRP